MSEESTVPAMYDLAWTAFMLFVAALSLWALVICKRKLSGSSADIAAIVVVVIPGVGALLVLVAHYTGLLSARVEHLASEL
mgnify:CR=1 FL=1